MPEIQQLKTELDEALVVVARSAQELSDNVEKSRDGRGIDCYYVEPEEMVKLRNALAHWKTCSQKFLEATAERVSPR